MKIKNIKYKIQSIFGITKSEINAVSVILLGLLISLIITIYNYYSSYDADEINKDNSKAILTRLAQKQQSNYVGSDINGYPDPELAKNIDTSTANSDSTTQRFNKTDKLPPGVKVNINTASQRLLEKIPGVGPAIAKRIIEHRNQNKFTTIEDIKDVKGIGEKKFEKMKSNLKVE